MDGQRTVNIQNFNDGVRDDNYDSTVQWYLQHILTFTTSEVTHTNIWRFGGGGGGGKQVRGEEIPWLPPPLNISLYVNATNQA